MVLWAGKAACTVEPWASRLLIDRLIHEDLREYVVPERAKRACDFREAAARPGKMLEIQAEQNCITSFMGWRPYSVHGIDW